MASKIITMICACCGTEKTERKSYFKRLISVERDGIYYCHNCIHIYQRNVNKSKKVVVKCVDCGKEREFYPSVLNQLKSIKIDGVYRCMDCTRKVQKRGVDKHGAVIGNLIDKNFKDNKIIITCADCGSQRVVYKSYYNNLKTVREYGIYRCGHCSSKNREVKTNYDSTWKEKLMSGIKNSKNTGKQKLAAKKRSDDLEYIKKMQTVYDDPSWQLNNKEGALKRMNGQGFWYGHPIINNEPRRQIYCEIWEDVKPRIAAFNVDMHDGVLTCEMCENPINNGSHQFVHHHVFYEKRACCWNENGIYTTNLNIKSMPKDSYIIGDNPNYFAITCISCHGKTNGNFENRKKWADFFKNKIDIEYDGKSYYTKEEMIDRNNILNKK